ncbi:hypothetical protein [Brachybacterium sp. UMB0905]|uniref:hypothetical protein n=1 Tax=Brachybacterium sp. UMB0905 TaxID=2069310 RepID=UPI00130419F8|nr:hypothetical protein [Brachybacterium sp. UMB0905]
MGFSALVSISRPELVLAADYLTALGMLALATMLALAVRWEEVRPAWGAVVPVLDMVAVALARDAAREHTTAVSLLVLVPTLWLAARLRRDGVVIAVVSTSALIALPSWCAPRTSTPSWWRIRWCRPSSCCRSECWPSGR